MKNNSFLYICLFEILIVYIMNVSSNQHGNKKYIIPKPNTKYISTHNIRHKHHYINRTLAISKNSTHKSNKPTTKVYSRLVTSTTKKPANSGKNMKPVDVFSLKHTLTEATLKKPMELYLREMTSKPPIAHKDADTTIDLLALTLKNKLLNNEDQSKLNDLSNTNNLAPPIYDTSVKLPLNDHEHYSGKSLPYFDQYLQKDSPQMMPPTNMSSDGSIQKNNDLMSKTDRFVNENSDRGDDDEDNEDDEDDDDSGDDDEDDEEDDISIFDDELSSSTLTSTSTTTTMSSTTIRGAQQEANESAETSKLNMVRSRSVPYRAEYAATLKSARSPPSIESPATEDSVQNLQRLASKHKNKVVRDAACRKPMPKVVKVSDVYPTATKIYLPQCTIIHQCAEDTGCCTSPFQKCGPKSSEKIDLYFYTYSTSAIVPGASPHQIEKLGFYNHTECECHEDMPRDDSNVIEQENKIVIDTLSVEDQPCSCPADYAVRRFLNGSCGCDCFDKERDCLRFKKGKEYFSLKDKWCIKTGKCHEPLCEFGKYSPKVGRCPRQNEKSRFF